MNVTVIENYISQSIDIKCRAESRFILSSYMCIYMLIFNQLKSFKLATEICVHFFASEISLMIVSRISRLNFQKSWNKVVCFLIELLNKIAKVTMAFEDAMPFI